MSDATDFAALNKLAPAQAVDFLQRRKMLTVTHSWQDLWHEEHAQQFTISRLTRVDLLATIQKMITKSVQGDLSRRDYMRNAKAALSEAGWWGEKTVIDPATGREVITRFDAARLKLIYDTNTRQAYAAGLWERAERNKAAMPYLRYITQRDARVRELHRQWDNVTLPVDHPFWNTHWPPCGYRCRCRAMSVSQREYDQGKTPDGSPMKKTAPEVLTRDWVNKRTGEVSAVPVGITPGFDYNVGQASTRAAALQKLVTDKLSTQEGNLALTAEALGMQAPKNAQVVADVPDWKSLGYPDLRLAKNVAVAPELLPGVQTNAEAVVILRDALGIPEGGAVVVTTPIEAVTILDSTLLHVVEKRRDQRERFANFVLPTLQSPSEIWEVAYDDATLRRRYLKVFSGSKYDLFVMVKVEPDGGIFWNMMQRDRKGLNALRVGERVYVDPAL
ncbi:PBECR2 nuclease fold domain-containing protein [Rhodoferax aquaticus]|uniref:Phage head morphogenesis domain-containing protein n=1 Tax=Rhodoferax aquaticus TaxID=2527691 RepID=A0A515ERR9_9BURK|nr:PBECR2 nuclease fold domain-containing protein [Rhodoferax aquaticus]QDL55338.1 hypothetical protein EXZ61_14805 [Rhodoferax aquaticus]